MVEFNVLSTRFIPVTCTDGSDSIVCLSEIFCTRDGKTPLQVRFADPFMNRAFVEMAAGIFQVTCAPETPKDWTRKRISGFTMAELSAIFLPFEEFFDIYGERPAFQVTEAAQDTRTKEWSVGRIVRDVSGSPRAMGLGAAAVALYGLQSHAHSGGRGYATSLSAGGPLRTVPDIGTNLFENIWDLVLCRDEFEKLGTPVNTKEALFPWCSPARVSATSEDSPASTVYFALPRRLLLAAPSGEGECPYSGEYGPLVDTVFEGPGGTDYPSDKWRHPLTPYRYDKEKPLQALPIRANSFSSGMTWKDRVGVLHKSSAKDGKPILDIAQILSVAQSRMWNTIKASGGVLPVSAYGQRYENASYNGALISVQPLRVVGEENRRFYENGLTKAVEAAFLLQGSLRDALSTAQITDMQTGNENAKKSISSRVGPQVRSMWSETEAAWEKYDAASAEAWEDDDQAKLQAVKEQFLLDMARGLMRVFDTYVPEPISEGLANYAIARRNLGRSHWKNKIRETLDLPVEKKKSEGKSKA